MDIVESSQELKMARGKVDGVLQAIQQRHYPKALLTQEIPDMAENSETAKFVLANPDKPAIVTVNLQPDPAGGDPILQITPEGFKEDIERHLVTS